MGQSEAGSPTLVQRRRKVARTASKTRLRRRKATRAAKRTKLKHRRSNLPLRKRKQISWLAWDLRSRAKKKAVQKALLRRRNKASFLMLRRNADPQKTVFLITRYTYCRAESIVWSVAFAGMLIMP